MTKPRPVMRPPMATKVRRAYFECRYGQLHTRYAIPAGGGFDEATPLLCIAGGGETGRFFQPLLLPLGRDRSVYAPDLPGLGESDPPPAGTGSLELAYALGDFLDSMFLRQIDVLAHAQGVEVALALVRQKPERVGRVVFSPDTPQIQQEARSLATPSLVINLGAVEGGRDAAETDRQAGRLREFLGLA